MPLEHVAHERGGARAFAGMHRAHPATKQPVGARGRGKLDVPLRDEKHRAKDGDGTVPATASYRSHGVDASAVEHVHQHCGHSIVKVMSKRKRA